MGTLSIPELGKQGNTEHPKVNAAIQALNAILGGENKVKGAGIESGAVEEEKIKDGATTSRKSKLSVGVVSASGSDLTLTTSYQDVPGASLEITPAVASVLLVHAVFDLGFIAGASAVFEAVGTMKVDSDAEQARLAVLTVRLVTTESQRASVAQTYAIPLTAAKHTLKLRAKRGAENGAVCYTANTSFSYLLLAS
jgi:hypothetical protein